MNTPSTQSEFLFLIRGNGWDRSLSPAELQQAMASFLAWFERLSAEGIMKAGQPLMDDARLVSWQHGRAVADGPFAEAKEAVGGYFLIQAPSLEAATRIAQECPTLRHGVTLEVRPIADACPTSQRLEQRLAEEPALAAC